MNRTHVDSDWNNGAVSYALRHTLRRYTEKTGSYPNTIYASSNLGNFFPFVLCTFAIRHKLVIKFVANGKYKPFFYFGSEVYENDQKGITDSTVRG